MKRKEFVVFGVGDFGMYVAKTLANSGAGTECGTNKRRF